MTVRKAFNGVANSMTNHAITDVERCDYLRTAWALVHPTFAGVQVVSVSDFTGDLFQKILGEEAFAAATNVETFQDAMMITDILYTNSASIIDARISPAESKHMRERAAVEVAVGFVRFSGLVDVVAQREFERREAQLQ